VHRFKLRSVRRVSLETYGGPLGYVLQRDFRLQYLFFTERYIVFNIQNLLFKQIHLNWIIYDVPKLVCDLILTNR